jgi:hypothetical protein
MGTLVLATIWAALYGYLIAVWKACLCRHRKRLPASGKRVRVAIAGGGFGGLYLARELGHDARFEVVLIEPKLYAEYTPGVMKTVVRPEAIRQLQVDIRHAVPDSVRVVQALVHHMTDGSDGQPPAFHVQPVRSTRNPAVDTSEPPAVQTCEAECFDAAVIATGSSYRRPYKADHLTCPSSACRYRELLRTHDAIKAAGSVVVVGGGPVGVELAAEILHKWPAKGVTVIQGAPVLLAGMHASIADAAASWLTRRGARLLLGQKVLHEGDSCTDEDDCDVLLEPGAEAPPDGSRAGLRARVSAAAKTVAEAGCSSGGGENNHLGPAAPARSSNGASGDSPSASGSPSTRRWLLTDRGERLVADVVLHCAGVVPNTGFLSHPLSSRALSACLLGAPAAASSDKPTPSRALPVLQSGSLAAGEAKESVAVPQPVAAAALNPRIAVDECLRIIKSVGSSEGSTGSVSNGSTSHGSSRAGADASYSGALDSASRNSVITSRSGLGCLVYGLGDVVAHPTCPEPALGHTAEKHAEVILRSLRAVADRVCCANTPQEAASTAGSASAPMWRLVAAAAGACSLPYPQTLTGRATAPVIMDVSLGPYEALLSFDCLQLHGPLGGRLAAGMKLLLEVTKVWQMRNWAVGTLFWEFADAMALRTHTYLTEPLQRLVLSDTRPPHVAVGEVSAGAAHAARAKVAA